MDLRESSRITHNRHPWEISRSRRLLSMLRDDTNLQYADVGAGDMYIAKKLRNYTNIPIYAIDAHYSSPKYLDGIIMLRSIENIPGKSIDRVLLLDVLEHVKDESSFLKDVLNIMKDNGKVFITVPAFQFLFSPHDIFLRHFRRYSLPEIEYLLKKNGLMIVENFYFYTIAFIIRSLELFLYKLNIKKEFKGAINKWKYKEDSFITRLIAGMFDIDFTVNRILKRFNIILPGLSICVVCRKKSV